MPEFTNIADLVREDIMEGLGTAFEPTTGYALLESFATEDFPVGPVTFVPWQYGCRHVDTFRGIPPTGREITIVGATAVEGINEETPLFHRFVDWANVFSQMGLTISARPLLA